MLRATRTRGRRCALPGASAAVACLTGLLTACGGGSGGDGYVAVGPPRPSTTAVRPTGSVTLVPLDAPKSPAASGTSETASTPEPASGTPTPVASPPTGAKSGPSSTTSPSPTPTTGPTTAPGTPAALSWGDPVRKATDQRWCEDVTLSFRNSGGTAVRSGTVTLGTHIIGALGIDWATIDSTEKLPAPIAADARKDKTWTVCVDAWRVPLGMHIETRDVSVEWK
ncbi:hypothetical protein ACFWP5_17240 [Streptomyces sp. NPDC058469]|uniref:hypothetical protein n=1 Tax=Streptomyces sp. NPDC058469 TaxID=3346514 RepID=UPI00366169E9